MTRPKRYFHVILFFCLFVCLFLIICIKVTFNYYTTTYDFYLTKVSDEYLSSNQRLTCRIPKLDPYDPTIVHLIKHPKNLHCPKVQPFLTYLDYNGNLVINTSEISLLDIADIRCYFRTFDRSFGFDDNSISYGKYILFNNSSKLNITSDTLEVKCLSSNRTQIYYNLHVHPRDGKKVFHQKPSEKQLNVLFFMIDSVSYSAFQRNLPLTYNYTKDVMEFIYFKAFNKIGDNSFPNMMAMLTGKRVVDEQDDMMTEIPSDNLTYFDEWPLVWKQFSRKGYSTTFNEDMSDYGLFHYGARGFRRKPTDHYYHTFWNKINDAEKFEHLYYCFYNTPKALLHLDITKRHFATMKNRRKFVFTVLSEHAHDYENDVELIDDKLVEFWRFLFEGNYLNHTVVLFASDHGIRYGKIRSSMMGLLEERLPYYGVWFPKWFYRLHPHIRQNLHNNAEVLTGTFDIYETLLDIVNANFDSSQQRCPTCRGQSHLYPLAKNRTCASAGIPDPYCTCVKEEILSVKDKTVLEAAHFLVDYLNSLLRPHDRLCHVIKFTRVLYVKRVDFDQKLKANIKNYNNVKRFENDLSKNRTKSRLNAGVSLETLEVAVETEPYQASFEAFVKSSINLHNRKIWTLIGTISRITKYEGLSDCIDDKTLRKYCSCKILRNNVVNGNN